MNFRRNWLSIVKYIVLVGLVLWIWRTIRKDSTEYFHGSTKTQSSSESFDTPVYNDSNALNGYSEKFEDADNANDTSYENGQCTSCSAGGVNENGVKLLPVMDPLFNLREICKECILLEQHLNIEEKTCLDCITKHSLTIEALAEEAVGLDNEGKYKFLNDLARKCRQLQKECNNNKNRCDIAQKYRKIRKSLMPLCKDRC